MKVKYDYGSKPAEDYNYKCFVKSIAPILPKDDKVFIYDRQLNWRRCGKIPLGLFRNICHWKSSRPFKKYVRKNTALEVNKRWQNALQQLKDTPFQDNAIKKALKDLTELKGVAVPTASALLTAWNPDEFGIIDFKVLKVLGIDGPANIDSYTEFRNRLLKLRKELKLDNCSLRQIELAIWHYYPIQNVKEKERPDN
ncbi:MAG: hypothetical protein ACYS67_02870 [Planctomycetota bacterium]|jgi:hypothetical protein